MTTSRTFVGFGFGAIQAGLFASEAWRSGRFGRIVVAEVQPEVVAAVRANGGCYGLNVANSSGIETCVVGPIEILNPRDPGDRDQLIAAVAAADELATALPSVTFFGTGASDDVAGILAAGLRGKSRPSVIYAGENHNHAAEILAGLIEKPLGCGLAEVQAQALNTVIGKMSSVVTDAGQIKAQKLIPMTPGATRAFLVEEFNHILISRITLSGFQRGIAVFEEKDDLLPFEEAKLYGHNAIHALIGYLANDRGCRTMAEAGKDAVIMDKARTAFLDEAGAGLLHRHRGIDPLFTPAGFQAYAEDLLVRMVNPHLSDPVERVIRDPLRKLGWDDRLIGTMRLALQAGVEPVCLAEAVSLAVRQLPPDALRQLWPAESWANGEAEEIMKRLGTRH